MDNGLDRRGRLRQRWAESLDYHMHIRSLSRRALRDRLADYGVEVTVQAIGCWLRAETAPRPDTQAALAAVLGEPVHLLFPIEVAPPTPGDRRSPRGRVHDGC